VLRATIPLNVSAASLVENDSEIEELELIGRLVLEGPCEAFQVWSWCQSGNRSYWGALSGPTVAVGCGVLGGLIDRHESEDDHSSAEA
jgi:hypothetical protein